MINIIRDSKKKWNTHKWEMYVIPEKILKNYKNMSFHKTRPIIVISNAEFLQYKALILDCSTKKHNNSLEFYKWFSRASGILKTSYICLDKLHTIDSSYLCDKSKIKSRVAPVNLRGTILSFLNKTINSK